MSVALPIISFLHFGHNGRLRLDLISDLNLWSDKVYKVYSLAGLADVVPIAALEDPGGRCHLFKAHLHQKC